MYMKKLLCVFLSVFTALFICGCNGYSETDSKYLVSAMGFDYTEGAVNIFAEIVSDTETQQNTVLKASGTTTKQAAFNLGAQLPKDLVVDHCAVLAIGENVDKNLLADIINFCREVKNLNLGIYLVSCPDIQAVFSVSPSKTAIGYDIMELLERRKNEDGIDYKNRFYEIQALRENKSGVFSLPSIQINNSRLSILSERIYKQDTFLMQLDNTQSGVYSLICNRFGSGDIFIGGEFAHILNTKTKFSAKQTERGFIADYQCFINAKTKSKNFDSALLSAANELIKKAEIATCLDVFLLSENVYLNNRDFFEEYLTLQNNTQVKFSLR